MKKKTTAKSNQNRRASDRPPKINSIPEAICWIWSFVTKEILIIIIIGLIIFFNVSYNKKEGLVIKPGIKVEVKK